MDKVSLWESIHPVRFYTIQYLSIFVYLAPSLFSSLFFSLSLSPFLYLFPIFFRDLLSSVTSPFFFSCVLSPFLSSFLASFLHFFHFFHFFHVVSFLSFLSFPFFFHSVVFSFFCVLSFLLSFVLPRVSSFSVLFCSLLFSSFPIFQSLTLSLNQPTNQTNNLSINLSIHLSIYIRPCVHMLDTSGQEKGEGRHLGWWDAGTNAHLPPHSANQPVRIVGVPVTQHRKRKMTRSSHSIWMLRSWKGNPEITVSLLWVPYYRTTSEFVPPASATARPSWPFAGGQAHGILRVC